jgi:thiopeptide-type bacteriocin biosynthesis protein
VRAHARTAAGMNAFARRLAAALAPARTACDVVAVDEGEYRRETARYGGAASLEALERVFQAESDLACALFELDDPDVDGATLAVRALEALAIGLGLGPASRRALAASRRAATSPSEPPGLALEYRGRQRKLVSALSGKLADSATKPLSRFAATVRAAAASPPDASLASVFHMCVNRMVGTDPDVEALVYYLWDRALESVRARARGSRRRQRSS